MKEETIFFHRVSLTKHLPRDQPSAGQSLGMGCRVSKKNIQTSFLRDEEFMTFVDCSPLFFLLCLSTQMFPLSSFPNDFLLEYFLVSFFDISPSTAFLMSPFSHVFVFPLTAYYPWQNLSRSIEIKSQRIQVKESMLSICLCD